jgi:hypothetical protein
MFIQQNQATHTSNHSDQHDAIVSVKWFCDGLKKKKKNAIDSISGTTGSSASTTSGFRVSNTASVSANVGVTVPGVFIGTCAGASHTQEQHTSESSTLRNPSHSLLGTRRNSHKKCHSCVQQQHRILRVSQSQRTSTDRQITVVHRVYLYVPVCTTRCSDGRRKSTSMGCDGLVRWHPA